MAAEPPEWLKAYVPAEPEAAVQAQPAEAAAPEAAPAAFQSADVDKLARLSERLAATRGAREQEAEARFAEQRERDEEARRLVQERMEARWATEAAEAAGPPVAAQEPPPRRPPWHRLFPKRRYARLRRPVPRRCRSVSSEALTEILVSLDPAG